MATKEVSGYLPNDVPEPARLVLLGLHLASAARLDALTPLSVYVLAAMFGEDLTQGSGMVFLCCLVGALAWRRPLAP